MSGMNQWPLVVVGLAVGVGMVGCGSSLDGTCADFQSCPPADGGADGTTPWDGGSGPTTDAGPDHAVPTPEAGAETGGEDTGTPGDDAGVDAGCGDASTVDNCGQCGVVCTAPANASPTCASGKCGFTCNTGFISCQATCHDVTGTPATDTCVIDDTLAVFVAPSGLDTNAGTKEAPLKTIGAAIVAARKTTAHRVIACAGTYDEQVSLAAADDVGLQIFGGVACPGAAGAWGYTGQKAVVAPSKHGYALSVTGLKNAVHFEDFEFDAAAGTAAGESSIGAMIDSSPLATLKRVKITAGAGAKGADGTLAKVLFPSAQELKGGSATGDTPGKGCSKACEALGSTSGGSGGTGGGAGGDGTDGSATPAVSGGGAGQTTLQCSQGDGTKLAGASAPPGADSAGAASYGSWTTSGWQPAAGNPGSPGGPGQGGGGGGGSSTGAGGGGACGGCGGAGGAFGNGGGASIGLVVLHSASTVVLDRCQVSATTAGSGGAGTVGQPGQSPGGVGGLQDQNGGCTGGRGGNGGAGGAGGGGAGGISVGIAYQGTIPTLTSTTATAAANTAAGGTGGKPGSNDGQPGMTVSTWASP